MKQKHTAFTLIELLVVIVIIGILATVSTATFSGQRHQATIAKYRAERLQASRERFEECISIQTDHCGPTFIVYRRPDGVYKRNILPSNSNPGFRISALSGFGYDITPDGKFLFYTNSNNVYKKEINNTNPDNLGELFLSGTSSRIEVSPSGDFMLHSRNNIIYKKDLNSTNTNDLGTPINQFNSSSFEISPDATYYLYRNINTSSVHRKNISNTNLNDPGTPITNGFSEGFILSPDGDSVYYSNNSGFYKKDINNDDPTDPGTLFTNIDAIGALAITPDEQSIFYIWHDTATLYKKRLNNTDINDIGAAQSFGQVNKLVIFP